MLQHPLLSTLVPLFLFPSLLVAGVSLSSVTDAWNVNAATFNFTVPGSTLTSDEAQSYIVSNWNLRGKISWGGNDIVFSPDPSTSSSTLVRRAPSSTVKTNSGTPSAVQSVTSPASTDLNGQPPVLRIEYPQGSYSKNTGGTQFYAVPLNSSVAATGNSDGQYERMLLAYDIWFPTGYAWNMGGKLPGLRGGPNRIGCSGGNKTDGTGCFSTRLMWRSGGQGEIYAYIPTTQDFCKQSKVICNSDFGTSLARGSFSFSTGQWQSIWLLVVLNSNGVSNGVVQLWYNGVQAVSFTNLELRSSMSIGSIGGLMFSTFFGGDDSSWATPTTQYTYFRNMQLYAGYGAANGTGAAIKSAAMPTIHGGWSVMGSVITLLAIGFIGSRL